MIENSNLRMILISDINKEFDSILIFDYFHYRYGGSINYTQKIIHFPSLLQILHRNLSFIQTHPQDVVEQLGTMRKQMEDFIDAFKKRIDVEMTYSKNLANVSKALDKYIKPGT